MGSTADVARWDQTSLFPSAIRGCVSVAISGTLGVDHDEMKENWECGRKQADIPGSHEEKKKTVCWQRDLSWTNTAGCVFVYD